MLSLLLFSIYLQVRPVILTPAQHGFFSLLFFSFPSQYLRFPFY